MSNDLNKPSEAVAYKSRRIFTWEPVYEFTEKWEPTEGVWNDATSTGRKRLIFRWANADKTEVFTNHTFTECDFRGEPTDNHRSFIFNNCIFTKCDFSLSIIQNCKFTNCSFSGCSFSLCTFKSVVFRKCTWEKIYFSGSETNWHDTYLSNPVEFVRAHFVSTIGKDGKTLSAQEAKNSKVKSKRTQATTARNIYRSHMNTGEEEGFYGSIKATYLLESEARLSEHLGSLRESNPGLFLLGLPKAALLWLDIFLVIYFGFLNKWGWSVSKPLISLTIMTLLFGFIYHIFGFQDMNFWVALGRSAEISTIAGYTRSGTTEMSIWQRTVEITQLCISLSVHSVLFATIMARVSRAR